MDLNARKEKFSIAYINAVAAQSNVKISDWNHDSFSVDGTLRWEDGRRPMIDFQAKASSQNLLSDERVHLRLNAKNYDELREVGLPTPIILVVVLVPPEPEDWIRFTDEELCSRTRGYFLSLAGMPGTDGKARTVEIPSRNVFDREHLTELMRRADRREL
jgi:hypothetical protein